MAQIIIELKSRSLQARADAHDTIYDFLRDSGYSHDDAAEVADWAELAGIDEEFFLDGAKIRITD